MGRVDALFGAVIGALVGMGLAKWQEMASHAAVKVRPKLAEVGFIDAALTGHGADWVFYNEPIIGYTVSVVVVAFFLAVFGWSL